VDLFGRVSEKAKQRAAAQRERAAAEAAEAPKNHHELRDRIRQATDGLF
jgi:hypothetical protein